ncbi:MAG: YtxH domain-containing protein [Flavobacteriales bacterium]|jgi:gas vesicle protein|uniref:YtxH domain-containing protein n=1 Tax=Blattabacterium sp. (Mastotermes darwiniensis) TaxID=39768 RepID=UPI000231DF90|nr:YtxH domain-containing protein [Blattabacterium sp. (Mastotermes darwiniensis)]AER40424.1 hypothetical protein MADAR_106 [Blattabacterium sp. (Mastotermes darwiniensis) str. MADAR]MDR1804854.1 YtxH domain-containing protein [Flavobacteriales bacterium]
MKKGGSFFWGFILGTMAGIIVGILLYPQKKEHKIKNILGKKTEELRDNLQEISKKIGKKVHRIKSEFESKWKKNKIDDKNDKVEEELGT